MIMCMNTYIKQCDIYCSVGPIPRYTLCAKFLGVRAVSSDGSVLSYGSRLHAVDLPYSKVVLVIFAEVL